MPEQKTPDGELAAAFNAVDGVQPAEPDSQPVAADANTYVQNGETWRTNKQGLRYVRKGGYRTGQEESDRVYDEAQRMNAEFDAERKTQGGGFLQRLFSRNKRPGIDDMTQAMSQSTGGEKRPLGARMAEGVVSTAERVANRLASAAENTGLKNRPELSPESIEKGRTAAARVLEGDRLLAAVQEPLRQGQQADIVAQRSLETAEELTKQAKEAANREKRYQALIKKARKFADKMTPEEWSELEASQSEVDLRAIQKDEIQGLKETAKARSAVKESRGELPGKSWDLEAQFVADSEEVEAEALAYAAEMQTALSSVDWEDHEAVTQTLRSVRPLARRMQVAENWFNNRLRRVTDSMSARFPDQREELENHLQETLSHIEDAKKKIDDLVAEGDEEVMTGMTINPETLARDYDRFAQAIQVLPEEEVAIVYEDVGFFRPEDGSWVAQEGSVVADFSRYTEAAQSMRRTIEESMRIAQENPHATDRLYGVVESYSQLQQAARKAGADFRKELARAVVDAQDRVAKKIAQAEKDQAKLQKLEEKTKARGLFEKGLSWAKRKIEARQNKIDAKRDDKIAEIQARKDELEAELKRLRGEQPSPQAQTDSPPVAAD